MHELEKNIVFPYINYKGVFSIREAQPVSILFDSNNEYHGECYVLKAFDADKQDIRDFAVKDIIRAAYYRGILDTTGDMNTAKAQAEAFIQELEGKYL